LAWCVAPFEDGGGARQERFETTVALFLHRKVEKPQIETGLWVVFGKEDLPAIGCPTLWILVLPGFRIRGASPEFRADSGFIPRVAVLREKSISTQFAQHPPSGYYPA